MTGDADLAALYQDRVRHWAARVRNDRRLSLADLTVTKKSPICGSALTLDVRAQGRTIQELGYRVRACTLGMASAAVVVATAPGRPVEETLAAGQRLRALLAGEDACFPPPWEALEMFMAARDFPTRHSSILLPFEALAEAFSAPTPA
ncbi:iron-sulfur cluster assembly scaffold protein [Stappia indica]|uniref:iron-sulfur cluster assembly scaffold protein n=1 Tax=Stappia indica TaxID=538381 RepID=UPI001CD7ED01|nr:iron-sulfur cluster assembly scaffold protein [Stappia indica]MCA1299415.1 iron-sulfur cluster assembly scaffold protein [Stappia indica]